MVKFYSYAFSATVNLHIDHVHEWLAQTLSRFQTGQTSIEELQRTFEGATIDLKSNAPVSNCYASRAAPMLDNIIVRPTTHASTSVNFAKSPANVD